MIMTRLLPNRVALYAFILTLAGGLTACHQSIAPTEEELAGNCEQAVRITARVSPFGGVPAGTRAEEVTGTVDNEKTDGWKPLEKDIAVKGESRISRLYVFVTKRGSDTIEKTLYYYDAADYKGEGGEVVVGGKLEGKEIPASPLTTTTGEVTMDMTLLPGDYSFVLVANSPEVAGIVKSPQPLTTLSDLNKVFSMGAGFLADAGPGGLTSFDLGFPIIGYGDLTVPPTTQPDKQVELQPVILMERLEARVDVTLTTATNLDRSDYVTESDGERFDPSQYKLTQFVVLLCVDVSDPEDKKLYPYTLFPVEKEVTALPDGTPRYPLASYSPPEILDDEGILGPKRHPKHVLALVYMDNLWNDKVFWPTYVNNGDAGRLGMLWRQSLFFIPTIGPAYLYLPAVYFPGKKDPDKVDKVVRLQLKFTKLDGSETLTYRIPIHNEESASDYYSIRRNTIYDIDLTFYGSKLEVKQSNAKYTVDTWEDQPVDIPW